jgi:hypothetical protein
VRSAGSGGLELHAESNHVDTNPFAFELLAVERSERAAYIDALERPNGGQSSSWASARTLGLVAGVNPKRSSLPANFSSLPNA